MPLLVRKNIRTLGRRELLGPILTVERLELIHFVRGGELRELELYQLEDGSSRRAGELIFIEVDEELLVAMRMEATILAKDKKR